MQPIDHFRREGDGVWRLETHTGDDARVALPALDGAILIADVYSGVDLDEGARG